MTVMERAGWNRLSSDARLLVLLLLEHKQHERLIVDVPTLKANTGWEFWRLKPASDQGMQEHFIERAEGGIRLHTLICAETALATRRVIRKIKDEDKLPPGFATLWAMHPNGNAKQEAIAEYLKLNPDVELQERMAVALAQQVRVWGETGTPRDKVPHLRKWIKWRRWTDEIRTGEIGRAVSPKERQNRAAVDEALRQRGYAV